MPPFAEIYIAVLRRRPIKALQIAWWRITGRKVRALARLRETAGGLPGMYRHWLALHEPRGGLDRVAAGMSTAAQHLPKIAVHLHIPARQPLVSLEAALQSVFAQSYGRWEIVVTSEEPRTTALPDDTRLQVLSNSVPTRAAGMAQVLRATTASHVVPLAVDCTLSPAALFAYAEAIAESRSDRTVLYADQDERGQRGERSNPWLKPDWDAELFLAQDYLSAACAIPVDAVREISLDETLPDNVAVYALLAQLLLGAPGLTARRVRCVATTTPAGAWSETVLARKTVVRMFAPKDVRVSSGPYGTLRLSRPLPSPAPKVSVVIPTRDRLDLLMPCVQGVLHNTDYPDVELVIANNASVEPETLEYFNACTEDARVKIVDWPHPYNYAAINNFAVAQASGTHICLLNNDTEVINPTWLRDMMSHAVRPEVGAVGARLLYPDRSIQHAGVVVGLGGAAGHAHRGLAENDPGYFAQALVTRSATAVTAACLVVAKDKFQAVGGLDEEGLAIAYNDVDFCLKLRKAGYTNIYVPQAVLIHHESKSRGWDFAPEQLARYHRELATFQARWAAEVFQDPMHHPNLDLASETYRLKL